MHTQPRKKHLKDHLDKITWVHDNFGNIEKIYNKNDTIDGMLMDIGVSSHQLDEANEDFLIDKMHHWICV